MGKLKLFPQACERARDFSNPFAVLHNLIGFSGDTDARCYKNARFELLLRCLCDAQKVNVRAPIARL